MKRTTLILLGLVMAGLCFAQGKSGSASDTTRILSLEEMINAESKYQTKKNIEERYRKLWGKTTYLNVAYNTTTLSSDGLPTAGGEYAGEYKSDYGIAFQVGTTYNLHKKPIANLAYIGIDYTPVDLNYNSYKADVPSPSFQQTTQSPFSLPWHNKKWTVDFGMSVGPSLTLYPFTAIGKRGTDAIRLYAYYHVGYNAGLLFVNDVAKKDETTTVVSWEHGLYNCFGASLTWNFVGVGFESAKASKNKYQSIDSDYKNGTTNVKQTSSRVYLQFRF